MKASGLLQTGYRDITAAEERLERVDDTRTTDDHPAPWAQRRTQPGWLLLPLRLFLGFTFTYAGLDKLSDPHFFAAANDPLSVAAQMQSFQETSPIGPLVGIAADHPTAAGVMIALAELAIGLGTLVGLLARLAAVGGALLALSFLLTVSWQTRPFYYGSDIVFLFSWTPFILVGSAGVLSLDAFLANRRRPDEALLSRRALIRYGAAAVVLAAVGLNAAWVAVANRDKLPSKSTAGSGASPAPSAAPTASSSAPSTAEVIVATNAVPVGAAVLVTDPATGQQAHVLQPTAGKFACLSAICTHSGCTVAWAGNAFNCPCHGSKFDALGKVLRGPAARPLPAIPVKVEGSNVVRG